LAAAHGSRKSQSLLFTSGKGGVGTSNLVLNLAIALGQMGQRVVVVDADLGLANLDLLCDLAPRHDLGDVFSGRCRLVDAVVTGPGDISVVPGSHMVRTNEENLNDGPAWLAAEIHELGSDADFVLVDAGSGLRPAITTLGAATDQVVIVTTPEPTSLADAHAAICQFRRLPTSPRVRVLVNQAASDSEAAAVVDRLVASSRQFLGVVVSPLGSGWVRADSRVPWAVRSRRPFYVECPGAAASRGVRRLAGALVRERHPPRHHRHAGFFAALAMRWAKNSPAGSAVDASHEN
jgi:flagellar biosynthesis protein FlhG